jgi:hypothetical protein
VIYRASCVTCGEVVIRADESSLHMAGPKTSWRCTFRCPVCRRDTMWPVPVGASHLLAAGGAHVSGQPVPAMPATEFEPPPPAAQRKFQLDDVIDLHELLAGDAWFDQLVQSGPGRGGHSC